MAEIELRNITKRYRDGTLAVQDLDLVVENGEFLVLVGPSGCGKSTALRMIAGLEPITSGEILIDGRVVNDLSASKRDIAMVFQNYALYPHMTVAKNMEVGLKLRKIPKPERLERIAKAAALLGISEILNRKPANLSGGQRQRVAMGRAIVRDPAAFLLDEPLSNLDAKLRADVRGEIKVLQAQLGTTTVFVTHDQVEAMTMAHRIAVLRKGALQQAGGPSELYGRPSNLFVAGFLGSPPMNFLYCTVEGFEQGRLQLRYGNGAQLLEVATKAGWEGIVKGSGQRLIVGVRPEHLMVGRARPDAGALLAGKVVLVESLGSETLVYAQVEAPPVASDEVREALAADDAEGPTGGPGSSTSNRWCARIPGTVSCEIGAEVSLQPAPERVYLFDATTGGLLAGIDVETSLDERFGSAIGSS